MRATVVLTSFLVLAFAGCLDSPNSNAVDNQPVAVSVLYSKQTNNAGTTIDARLMSTSGLSDWNELTVTGCNAPTSGPFDLPHHFSGCSSTAPLRILEKETGKQLYSSQ